MRPSLNVRIFSLLLPPVWLVSAVIIVFVFGSKKYFLKYKSIDIMFLSLLKYLTWNQAQILKGAVSRDFRPLFFFMNRTHLGPCS